MSPQQDLADQRPVLVILLVEFPTPGSFHWCASGFSFIPSRAFVLLALDEVFEAFGADLSGSTKSLNQPPAPVTVMLARTATYGKLRASTNISTSHRTKGQRANTINRRGCWGSNAPSSRNSFAKYRNLGNLWRGNGGYRFHSRHRGTVSPFDWKWFMNSARKDNRSRA